MFLKLGEPLTVQSVQFTPFSAAVQLIQFNTADDFSPNLENSFVGTMLSKGKSNLILDFVIITMFEFVVIVKLLSFFWTLHVQCPWFMVVQVNIKKLIQKQNQVNIHTKVNLI